MDAQSEDQTLFPDINADEESGVTSIESLCVSCEENVSLCRRYSWVSFGIPADFFGRKASLTLSYPWGSPLTSKIVWR